MEKLCFISVIVHFVIVCRAERDLYSTETSILESTNEYVDRHSFYYDKETGKEVSNSFKQNDRYQVENGDDCGSCDRELRSCRISLRNGPQHMDLADELMSRRLVKTLLSRTSFKEEGQLFIGHLDLQATAAELADLRKFGDGQLTLREIDPILNGVIRTPAHDGAREWFRLLYDTTAWIRSAVSSSCIYAIDNKGMVAAVAFTFYVVHLLRVLRYKLWRIVPFGTMTILIMSFFITWWRLIQEAEINHMAKQMMHMKFPPHCRPDTMSLWEWLTTWFPSNDDCIKYYEARMKTPFFEVTPAVALTHMLSHAIYEPLTLSGKAISSFLHHVTAGMSPFYAGIVRVVICVTLFPTLLCCLILLAGGSLSFGSLGPLSLCSLNGPIKARKRRTKRLGSRPQRIPIEIMLNITTNSRPSEPTISELPLAVTAGINPPNDK